MAQHQELAEHLGVDVYIGDPRGLWKRGSNENTNRRLGRYLAEGAKLRPIAIRNLDDIAERIITRPRRVLD